jgi:hypothetical protein
MPWQIEEKITTGSGDSSIVDERFQQRFPSYIRLKTSAIEITFTRLYLHS